MPAISRIHWQLSLRETELGNCSSLNRDRMVAYEPWLDSGHSFNIVTKDLLQGRGKHQHGWKFSERGILWREKQTSIFFFRTMIVL